MMQVNLISFFFFYCLINFHIFLASEIYSCLFHPYKEILLTAGKDKIVNIYVPKKPEENPEEKDFQSPSIQEITVDYDNIEASIKDEVVNHLDTEEKKATPKKKRGPKSPKFPVLKSSGSESQTEKRIRLFGYACEKHRKEHLRCPLNCVGRRRPKLESPENEKPSDVSQTNDT